jgi:D-arabinonate dehydratase
MYTQTVRAGRRGNLVHALGAMDIALWDHFGKLTRQPLHKLLGGYRDEVPCYASGGYYYDDQAPMQSLENELKTYLSMGFSAFKMKIGRLSPPQEVERVRLARQMLGPERLLMLDANQAFRNISDVMSFVRKVQDYDIYWLEEPLPVDMVEGMARLRSLCPIPLATGEVEATRWAFSELLERRAVDVIQPDATACGGISEWMRIVALADIYGVPVAPHYHWDVHVQLGCAFPEVVMLEKFVGTDVKNFDRVLAEPLQVTKSGGLRPPEGPGLGVQLDEEAVHRYLVHETVTEG